MALVSAASDTLEISHPGDLLELRESIGDVRETLTKIEFPNSGFLDGGIIVTNQGTSEFNQYLRFSDLSPGYESIISPLVDYTENDAPVDEVGDWLYIKEGSGIVKNAFFEYELEFEDGLESKIEVTSLVDLENEELVILGSNYTILSTMIDTADNDITLDFITGPIHGIQEEGDTIIYNIDGKSYKVTVMIIENTSPPTVTFKINGEITQELEEGETHTLNDGTIIGVTRIFPDPVNSVEFYLGAKTVRFKDMDYTNSETTDPINLGYDNNVKINGNEIEDAWVQIKANELGAGQMIEIYSIKYRLTADALCGYKDVWVPPGHGVSEYLDEPDGMLSSYWDIRHEGLYDTGVSIIKLDPQGDDEYRLIFENRQGLIYNLPYITNENGEFKYGDDDDDFVFIEGSWSYNGDKDSQLFNIGINDFFLLSDMDEEFDETARSHVVRYESIETTDKQLQFDDLATGSKKFVYEDLNNFNNTIGRAELVFGGSTYMAYVANVTTNNDNPLTIDMNANGNISREEIQITVNGHSGGGILDLGNAEESDGGYWESTTNIHGTWHNSISDNITTSEVVFNLVTQDEDFDEAIVPESTEFYIENRTINRIGISTTINTNGGMTMHKPDNDDDNYFGMTDYGALVNLFDPEGTDDAETLTIEYPLIQRGANVIILVDIPDAPTILPDLTVLDSTHYPYNPEVGELVTVDLTIGNIGNDVAENIEWVYNFDYYGDGGRGSTRSGLNPGENFTLSLNHVYTEGKEYDFYFELDPQNKIEELNEKNNVEEIIIPVGDPDLTPKLASMHLELNNPKLVTFKFKVKNIGEISTENILYNVDYGDNSGGGGIISDSISAGGEYEIILTHQYHSLSGKYNLLFKVDPYNSIKELNERNNAVNKTIDLEKIPMIKEAS